MLCEVIWLKLIIRVKFQNISQVYQSFSAISSTNGSRKFWWHDHRNSIKHHLLWDRQSPSLEWTIIWQKSGNPQTSQTTAEKLAQYVYVSVCMLLYVCACAHVVELLSALQCMTAQFMTDSIACRRSVYGIIMLIVKRTTFRWHYKWEIWALKSLGKVINFIHGYAYRLRNMQISYKQTKVGIL